MFIGILTQITNDCDGETDEGIAAISFSLETPFGLHFDGAISEPISEEGNGWQEELDTHYLRPLY